MYFSRASYGPVDLAFTDRFGGPEGAPYVELDLAEGAAHLPRVAEDFAPGTAVAQMHQVHGNAVEVVGARRSASPPEADALVSAEPDTLLVVRVADCVPVLLADPAAGVIGAVHCGRPGVANGVVPSAVSRMRSLGATDLTAWIGPHICGACYEVPSALQAEVGSVVPEAISTTSWGTPALDIGAGVCAQLRTCGVAVVDVSSCTRETPALFSYRRNRTAARSAGLIRLRR